MMNYIWMIVGGYFVISMLATVVLYCACVLASRSQVNVHKLYGLPSATWSKLCDNRFRLPRSGGQPEALMRLWG